MTARLHAARCEYDGSYLGFSLLASEEDFVAAFPGADVQTIHGDAPFHNLICTAEG